MDFVPGWTYNFINSLDQYMAVNDKSGIMYTQDMIYYSKEEVDMLATVDFEIPLAVHLIKKVFGGKIISL